METNPTGMIEPDTSRTKTHADAAHLLRAIERGIVYDRLPAPISINIQRDYDSAKLRFAAAEDVYAWGELTEATIVTGSHVFRADSDSPWYEVGTEQGGREGRLAGWRVSLWASVDGLPAREIKARYLTAGMTVVDDVRERNLRVTVINPGAGDSVLVSFEGVPTWKPYGVEEAVTVLAAATPTQQAGE